MTADLLQFIFFAFSAMVSPGPNNLMIMHAGLNFGYRKSMPHFFGIMSGVVVMFAFIAFGFGYVFKQVPDLKVGIKLVGTFYMLYLAWKISQMNENKTDTDVKKPLTYTQAVFFQWVNPKAWVISIAFSSMFEISSNFVINSALLISIICLINIPCLLIWMSFGKALERIIKCEKTRNRLNYCLAALLFLSIIVLWI